MAFKLFYAKSEQVFSKVMRSIVFDERQNRTLSSNLKPAEAQCQAEDIFDMELFGLFNTLKLILGGWFFEKCQYQAEDIFDKKILSGIIWIDFEMCLDVPKHFKVKDYFQFQNLGYSDFPDSMDLSTLYYLCQNVLFSSLKAVQVNQIDTCRCNLLLPLRHTPLK